MVKGGYPVKDTLAKFQAAREAEPDMPRLTLMEGLYRYEKDKQDTKARDLLEAGLAAGKELAAASLDNIARLLPYVYWRLGNIAEDRAELDAAAGYYKQALAARPGFSEGLIALLLVYRQQGQDDTELIEWTKKHYGEKDIVFLATVTESLGGGLYAYWKGEAEHRGWGIAKRLTAIDKMKAFAKHMKPLAKLCEAEEGILAVDKFRYLLQQVEPLPPEAMWLAWNNRVHCCDVLFDTEGAVECQLGQAVNIAGQKAGSQSQAYSNYLFNLHYLESTTDKELREMSFKYNMMYERIVPFQHPLSRHQHQKLRIGYLADRFVENVVSYFGIQLFGIYDRSRFEVYCYSCTSKRDELTKFIEKRVTKMSIPSEERKPSEIAEEIYDDGIDILFDLCGHTAGGITLAVMPYKPAPISISGIGYMSTTGLKSVDYYLGDPYCDPVGLHEDDFSEKLLRVKHSHFCYTPPEKVQRVQKSWHPKNDIIFASFSNLHKVTKHQVAVWAKILQQVPGARMILRSSIPNRYAMRRVREAFVDHGIEPGRLIADVTDIDYFSRYMDVDILLDTYPYVGGGTICDALYVGVPVVSRYGRRHGQRFSHSILENANLGELSVKTDEEYIAKAVALAQDRELLAALHAAIPQMFRNSPVMDAKGYVRDIEEVYEQVFQEWQQEQMQQEAAERQAEHEQQA
jgi:predicted O-linked N-acetylglucosamine transferase (SPINDLY family)